MQGRTKKPSSVLSSKREKKNNKYLFHFFYFILYNLCIYITGERQKKGQSDGPLNYKKKEKKRLFVMLNIKLYRSL